MFQATDLMPILSIVMGVTSVILFFFWLLHRSNKSILDWAVGKALFAIGLMLILQQASLPLEVSILIAHIAVFAGGGILLRGCLRFADRPAKTWLIVGLPLLFWLPFLFIYDRPEFFAFRYFVHNVGIGTLALMSGIVLGVTVKARQWARTLTAWIFAFYGSVALLGGVRVLLNWEQFSSLQDTSDSLPYLLIWLIVQSIVVTSSLVIMVSERLRNELTGNLEALETNRLALERALDEQRNLLSMVSHEFRTPLSSIAASSEVVGCNVSGNDVETHEELDRIRRMTVRLSTLVDACLADDWLDASGVGVRMLSVDLAPLLNGLAGEYGAHLTCGAEPTTVHGNPQLLQVALSSLLDNARKYGRTPEGLRLDCYTRSEADGDRVVIDVHDDGPGVRTEDLPSLYNKYYRSPSVLRHPGAGLGLFLVKRIMTQHGGAVYYHRDDDTVFRLILPMAAGPTSEAGAS